MRDYSGTDGFPSATYFADTVTIGEVIFNAFTNQNSGMSVVVQFSLDGTTWSTGTTVELTSSDASYSVDSDVVGATYVRWTVSHTFTPDKQRVSLDDVYIY
jgi:hypothetical protein